MLQLDGDLRKARAWSEFSVRHEHAASHRSGLVDRHPKAHLLRHSYFTSKAVGARSGDLELPVSVRVPEIDPIDAVGREQRVLVDLPQRETAREGYEVGGLMQGRQS